MGNDKKQKIDPSCMKHKRTAILLVFVLLICLLSGCLDSDDEVYYENMPGKGKKVGIAMPTQNSERWIYDCSSIKEQLEALGYRVVGQFADDDVALQIGQIDQFISQKVDCLVIAAIDSTELTAVEYKAQEAGIPIIAYDRLLMDTDAVSYYATFDNKRIGSAIAETIVAQAKLQEIRKEGGHKTIEFFMGSPDDNNAIKIYEGLMEVLQPYLDDGTLVCRSGKISFEDTCILRWSQDTAEERCRSYLAEYYENEELDICASAFDKFSYGCIQALEDAGYTEENWPIISGQDAELEACRNIVNGKQSFTVYKDARLLAEKCVGMVNAICLGTEAEINDTTQYNNNVKDVPSYLCTPVIVSSSNMKTIMIDGGYYQEEQVYE